MGGTRLVFLIIGMFVLLSTTQAQTPLPRTQQAVALYDNGELVEAKDVILVALQDSLESKNPYTWCVKGFIFKEIYKTIENKDKYSSNRDIAIESIKQSMILDKKQEYLETNVQILNYLSSTLFNDVVQITRSMNAYNVDEPEQFYLKFKKVQRMINPTVNLADKDLELYRVLAEGNDRIYLQDPDKNIAFFDRAVDYYSKALEIAPSDTISNYNLAVMFYNRGVQKIKKIDHQTEIFELITIQDECIDLFKQSLPYMEKAHNLDPYRKEPIVGLRAIYKSLSEDQKEAEYKDLLESYIRDGVIKKED